MSNEKLNNETLDFILSNSTKLQVKSAFESGNHITNIDSDFNSGFRLERINDSIINLNTLIFTDFGEAYESVALYYKDGKIIIPKLYFDLFVKLNGGDSSEFAPSTYSLLNNALIAAFSHESLSIVEFAKDASVNINGLDLDYFEVEEGEVNIFLDDKHRLRPNMGLAVGYSKNNTSYINIPHHYKEAVDNLKELKVLSAFRINE